MILLNIKQRAIQLHLRMAEKIIFRLLQGPIPELILLTDLFIVITTDINFANNAEYYTCYVSANNIDVPANIYLVKVNNKNTKKWCEKCSKLTLNTTERRY